MFYLDKFEDALREASEHLISHYPMIKTVYTPLIGAGLAHGNVQTIMEVYQRISFQYADIYFKVYESHRGNYDLAINCLKSTSIDLTLF